MLWAVCHSTKALGQKLKATQHYLQVSGDDLHEKCHGMHKVSILGGHMIHACLVGQVVGLTPGDMTIFILHVYTCLK